MRYFLILLAGIAFLTYYHTPPELPPAAGLSVTTVADARPFDGQTHSEGEGNSRRVLMGKGSGDKPLLELAAGERGRIVYTCETASGADRTGRFRVQFLSTQGTGRIVLEALDNAKQPVATIVWLVTGPVPPADRTHAVIDKRLPVNYRGDWLKGEWNIADLLRTQFGKVPFQAETYRLSVVTGEGQHALISELNLSFSQLANVKITPEHSALRTVLGEKILISAELENRSNAELPAFQAGVWGPYGDGVIVEGLQEYTVDSLPPGGKIRLTWTLKAQRPDAVNMGNPWPVSFTVNGLEQGAPVQIAVKDNRPGKLYYVMTEDLEPMDSAGYSKRWGNADGWLNPEELRVQMIDKAERLNQIAEQYGAKWTHYIAWPAVRAAEWASTRSAKAEWQAAVADLRRSVIEQSGKGHEYGLHLHTDYDPDLKDNVLSYNPDTDGFWANHLRHGWAHSVLREGDFSVYDSRVGILYFYQRLLDQLAQDSPQGQLLTARAGSFDFGADEADEAMSTRASKKVGLWGSSDADGNIASMTSADYGREIYLARFDDINQPAESPAVTGLVEFRPTPREPIMYDIHPAAVMNTKADRGVKAFAADGQIKPGVHAIIGFTHAMFILGDGDWRSLEGGQFAELDRHLRYLKTSYADKGLLHFATATELVADYLDYYTPVPVAVYGAKTYQSTGMTEYAVRILGKDIPVGPDRPYSVSVKLPLYLRDSAFFVQILKNGEPIYSTWEPAGSSNDIPFVLNDSQAVYTMRIYYDEELAGLRLKILQWWKKVWAE